MEWSPRLGKDWSDSGQGKICRWSLLLADLSEEVLGEPSLAWSPETCGGCVQNPNPNLDFITAWLQGLG